MPRAADPDLPKRILDAADALWKEGGNGAVTIRGVAIRAKTSTPTVYSYFRSRDALLVALRTRAYKRFDAFLAKSKNFEENCERHLEFGDRHRRDYDLLYGQGWFERATPKAREEEIAHFAAVLVRCGVPEKAALRTAYPILMMLHGAVMHLISNRATTGAVPAIREACLDACMTLMRHARRNG